ncbi:hypothetical protein BJV78DRAFT_187790 [Lactifluus subvellereus]|nr:hypothetical protein BJV78DRAFT_187790 [Lactifluus subvellereus]
MTSATDGDPFWKYNSPPLSSQRYSRASYGTPKCSLWCPLPLLMLSGTDFFKSKPRRRLTAGPTEIDTQATPAGGRRPHKMSSVTGREISMTLLDTRKWQPICLWKCLLPSLIVSMRRFGRLPSFVRRISSTYERKVIARDNRVKLPQHNV